MPTKLFVALLAALLIVVSAPFMGQIRGTLQASLPPGDFRLVVGAGVVGAVTLAVVAALVRIRERRWLRYGALVMAVGVGLGYALVSSTGNASVDAVERFHFVEYGLLTLLFYRVWRHREDLSTLIAPVLAAVAVATLDEWIQWLVPLRVGELRDVALDSVAIGCGMLFALGLDPPARVMPTAAGASAGVRLLPAIVVVTLGGFVDVIHLGHEVAFGQTIFRSRFTIDMLEQSSRDRASRWGRQGPPVELRRLSREDQYMAEGVWHVQRRNEASSAGDDPTAWRENLILEQFFAPVLDYPSYAVPAASRWPPEQRADVERRVGAATGPYVSTAEPFPLYPWSRGAFRVSVLVVVFVLMFYWRRLAGVAAGAAGRASK